MGERKIYNSITKKKKKKNHVFLAKHCSFAFRNSFVFIEASTLVAWTHLHCVCLWRLHSGIENWKIFSLFTLSGEKNQRFALMLHYSEHRRLFPKESYWNSWNPYFLCPFFGIPSGLYFAHHVVMHHQENNFDGWDVSSTEPYQRDHFTSFLHYWLRWIIGVWFALPYYLYKRKNWPLFTNLLYMLLIWGFSVATLYRLNPQATFWVFILPVMITQFLFSFGNYSQHIFVDPNRPNDNYVLTYCCINATDNQYSFNDGYHITHHINARLHWR